MRLIKVGCQGYKRFEQDVEMDVDEKLIAIVGPNEAGKTSFLEALARTERDVPLPDNVRTRGSTTSVKVWARYVLDDDDKEALAGVPEARGVRQFIVTLSSEPRYRLEDDVERDRAPRHAALKIVDRALAHKTFTERHDDDELILLARAARAALASEEEDLGDDERRSLSEFAAVLKDMTLPKALARARGLVAQAHANEAKENPWETTIEILKIRRPRFLPFEVGARDLRSSYSFEEEPNAALHNLLSLAGTSWSALYEASTDPGALEGVHERSRERLDATFQAWKQSRLVVRLLVKDNAVAVLVRMAAREDYLGIEERSDGLRQFVALRAHVAAHSGAGGPPILLVDEAETHLHYNAQADLIQVLEEQEEAAKVIYTTHSAGCLPQDLGRGIRIILPVFDDDGDAVRETDASRIVNWFWTDEIEGTGFSPLLIGMGASTFAFASTRRAIIAEGAADAILLPTLIREAGRLGRLDYQIAPGLANVDAAAARELDLVAARVAYVLDGDEAGDEKEALLIAAGIPKRRIVRLGSRRSKIVLEDVLDADVYLARMALLPERGEAVVVVPATQCARAVTRGERGRLVEEEELREATGLQQRATLPAAVLELAGDPALARVAPPDAPGVVVQAATIPVDEAAPGMRDQLAERCDSVCSGMAASTLSAVSGAMPETPNRGLAKARPQTPAATQTSDGRVPSASDPESGAAGFRLSAGTRQL
jgi:ABC-type cobalamin/Fe3+-siderophores transport system ATPase subunit